MFIGTAGQGQFSDRFGRRFIYQFNLLLFGVFTILGAFAPNVTLLVVCRFIAGIGLGAEQPLAFAYAGEYSPKAIRGRILAIMHFIGGACVWPIGTLLVLCVQRHARSPEHVWRGVWLVIGIGALIVWVFRFTLPESPRYLATHGRGEEALDVLGTPRHRRADRAADHRRREQHQERSVRRRVPACSRSASSPA